MVNINKQAILKRTALFSALAAGDLDELAAICTTKHLAAQEQLFAEGDPATAFFVLATGQIQAYKLSAEGKEMILHVFTPGSFFAEYPIFTGNPTYPAYTLATEDSTVLVIDAVKFKTLAAAKPELLMRIIAHLANKLREFNGLIEDLSLRSVDARLAKYLLLICDGQAQVEMPLQKKALAALLGTVPETLSRAFKRLSTEHIIQLDKTKLTILNEDRLKHLAAE